jgi:hypothetical protein
MKIVDEKAIMQKKVNKKKTWRLDMCRFHVRMNCQSFHYIVFRVLVWLSNITLDKPKTPFPSHGFQVVMRDPNYSGKRLHTRVQRR